MSGKFYSDSDFLDESQPSPTPSSPPQNAAGGVYSEEDFLPEGQNLGDSADSPLNEAGLSIIQRAALGWAGGPQAQEKFLKKEFGPDRVKVGANGNWSIKGEDGKWRMADPTGWNDTLGEIAQWAGDKGTVSVGATVGGIKGAALGSFAGPIGSAIGLVAGGAAGAAAAKGGELAVKAATGTGETPQDIGELQTQLAAAMAFGAEQEGLGFLGGKVLGTGAKALGYVLNRIGRTEAGIAARTALTQALGGMAEPLANAWAKNPMKTAAYQEMAISDMHKGTNTLMDSMKTKIGEFATTARKYLASTGREYEEIAKKASGIRFDVTPDLLDAYGKVINEGYLTSKLEPVVRTAAKGEKAVEGAVRRAAVSTGKDLAVLQKAAKEGRKLTYQELRNLKTNAQNLLSRGDLPDKRLAVLIRETRSAIDTALQRGLDAAEPGLGTNFLSLNQKYGPLRDFVDNLADVTDETKIDAFLKKVIRQDGTAKSELITNVSNAMGLEDITDDILRMAAAQDSRHIFVNRGAIRFAGMTVPRSPRMAAAALKSEMAVRDAFSKFNNGMQGTMLGKKAMPYLTETYKAIRGASAEVRRQALEHPQTVQGIRDLVTGAMMGEDDATNQIMQETGL